ncbi:MAG: beta-galactosidase trimerization domain-containing protein, partial [Christensenellaceae bacterium]
EPWCYGEESTTRLGVYLSRDTASDQGLHSMLLEKQLDFTVVLPGDDLSAFDAVILPDCVQLSAGEAARLQAFARQGGGVLLTGESAVKDGAFQLDTGLVYQGRSQCDVDYLKAGPQLTGCDWLDSPFLCYQSAVRTQVQDAEVLGQVYEPWFNRTYSRYCSHQFTPYRDEPAAYPGIARKGNIVYLAHNLCRMYKTDGAQLFRDILCGALRLIYRPVMEVSMPSAGRARLTRQGGRYVLHLMYGSPIQRGRTSVIEDLPALRDIPVTLRISEPLAGAILQPQGQPVAFTQAEGLVTLTVPQVACHQMVELTLR